MPPAKFTALHCLLFASLTLAGCALYHARPLPAQPDLAKRLPLPPVQASTLHLPALAPHPFDARGGLDMTDVAILAVLNDPALKTLRAEARANAAQVFAAGLLPGPQLSYSRDHPATPGYANAHNVGIAYDLNAIVASYFQKQAAAATARQGSLDVLWAEWQVAAEARLLYVRVLQDERKLALLKRLQQVVDARYRGLRQALKRGDVTYATAGILLAAVQDVDARVQATERDASDARYALNELLGVAPQLSLPLRAAEVVPPAPAADIAAALKALPQRRPDLIALRYSYASADAELRRAVLAQFPGITLGVNRANDTSNVRTIGFSVSLNFPFLTGGPAEVRAAEASRDALWQTYQQRLDEAVSGVHTVAADLRIVERQLAGVRASLPQTERAWQAAQDALRRGDLAAPAYYDLAVSSLNRQLQAVDLETEQQQLRLVLATLLGLPPEDLRRPVVAEDAR